VPNNSTYVVGVEQSSSAVEVGSDQHTQGFAPASSIRLPFKRGRGCQLERNKVGGMAAAGMTSGGVASHGGVGGRQRHHSAQDTSQIYCTPAQIQELLKLLQSSDDAMGTLQAPPPPHPPNSTQSPAAAVDTLCSGDGGDVTDRSVECSSPLSPEVEQINRINKGVGLNAEDLLHRSVSAPSYDWSSSFLSLMETEDDDEQGTWIGSGTSGGSGGITRGDHMISGVTLPRIDPGLTEHGATSYNSTQSTTLFTTTGREMSTPPSSRNATPPFSPELVGLMKNKMATTGGQYLPGEDHGTLDTPISLDADDVGGMNAFDNLFGSMCSDNSRWG